MITTMLEMCFANPHGGLEARLDKIAIPTHQGALLREPACSSSEASPAGREDNGRLRRGIRDRGTPIEERKLIISMKISPEFDIDANGTPVQDSYSSTAVTELRRRRASGFDNYRDSCCVEIPSSFTEDGRDGTASQPGGEISPRRSLKRDQRRTGDGLRHTRRFRREGRI